MVMGGNRVCVSGGRELHVQVEDLGPEAAAFEARVYDQGALVWQKKVPYGDLLAQKLPKLELEDALQALVEKTLLTVEAAIAKGRL